MFTPINSSRSKPLKLEFGYNYFNQTTLGVINASKGQIPFISSSNSFSIPFQNDGQYGDLVCSINKRSQFSGCFLASGWNSSRYLIEIFMNSNNLYSAVVQVKLPTFRPYTIYAFMNNLNDSKLVIVQKMVANFINTTLNS